MNSSSFFERNAVGPANMRLLSTVSMWKTFMCFCTMAPWRSIFVLSIECFGSMYADERIVDGSWCTFVVS